MKKKKKRLPTNTRTQIKLVLIPSRRTNIKALQLIEVKSLKIKD